MENCYLKGGFINMNNSNDIVTNEIHCHSFDGRKLAKNKELNDLVLREPLLSNITKIDASIIAPIDTYHFSNVDELICTNNVLTQGTKFNVIIKEKMENGKRVVEIKTEEC